MRCCRKGKTKSNQIVCEAPRPAMKFAICESENPIPPLLTEVYSATGTVAVNEKANYLSLEDAQSRHSTVLEENSTYKHHVCINEEDRGDSGRPCNLPKTHVFGPWSNCPCIWVMFMGLQRLVQEEYDE